MELNSVVQILTYTVELLGDEAHHILSRIRKSGIPLKDNLYFRFLFFTVLAALLLFD